MKTIRLLLIAVFTCLLASCGSTSTASSDESQTLEERISEEVTEEVTEEKRPVRRYGRP